MYSLSLDIIEMKMENKNRNDQSLVAIASMILQLIIKIEWFNNSVDWS